MTFLGKKILTERKRLGFTQSKLAELADCSVRMIQKVEYGESWPGPELLKRISSALNLKAEDLFSDNAKSHDDDYSSLMKKIDSLQVMTPEGIAEIVAKKLAESRQPVSKQDTKNMSEKDKLILQITSSLPLLNVNNLTGINNSINRLVSKGRIKKSVNS